MITRILNLIFGCRHRNTTWPYLDLNNDAYVVCLECGTEMLYEKNTASAPHKQIVSETA